MSGDSKVWAHSSADTWAAQTGISTYDLDTHTSIKREKISPEVSNGVHESVSEQS